MCSDACLPQGCRRRLGRLLSSRMSAARAAASALAGSLVRRLTGYTVVLGIWNTHVANGVTYKLDYDVVKDFAPVALCADAPLVLLAKKSAPADDLHRVAEGKSGQGLHGDSRYRQPRSPSWVFDAKGHRRAIYLGALSGRRPLGAGRCRGADRHDVRQHGNGAALRARRQSKSPRRDVADAHSGGTRHSGGKMDMPPVLAFAHGRLEAMYGAAP